MTGADRWRDARKVLAVRLDSMGDVLMTGPALAALAADGRREVTLLTSPAGAHAARLMPPVARVIEYAAPWMKAPRAVLDPSTDLDLVARLRAERFDAAVIFTVFSQSPLPAAMLCFLAGIPLRLAHCRENPYHLLTDWVPEREPHEVVRHEVQRQLDLVETVGCTTQDARLSVRFGFSARVAAQALLRASGVAAWRPWLALHCGATAASRRYAPERYVEVIRQLTDLGWQVVLIGATADVPLVESIRAEAPARTASIAGRTTVEELAALLSSAPVLIANNSGPAHLAAAVGTPVVDLYALTNPQHAPWGVPHRLLFRDVPCAYCYGSVCQAGDHACLDVSPAEVTAAALALTQTPGARGDDVLPVIAPA